MANNVLFADWLALEAMRTLVNQLEVSPFFNNKYTKEYTREFAVGETIHVKLPQRWTVRDGLGYNPQPINRKSVPITVDQIFGIDFEIDSIEKALKFERSEAEMKAQYIDPAMAQLASEIDSRCAKFAYQNTNNIVGILGTDPNSMTTFLQARQRLIELACPPTNDKGMIIPPSVETSLIPALASFFNPTSEISEQYKEGSMGRMSNFDWYSSVTLAKHTAGTIAGAFTVNGSGQTGSSLKVNLTAADTLFAGDVISIALVNPVNPMTRRIVGSLTKQFVVLQDVVAVGAGNDTLNISPAIAGPGDQYQNVDALPLDTQAITLFAGTAAPSGKSGIQGLALHPDAFALVGVKLEMPKAVELSSQARDPKSGISVRFIRSWDNVRSMMTNRFDVLMGFGALYPDNCAVRVLGA